MNPVFYNTCIQWVDPFFRKWDYTIAFVFMFLLACIGLGAICFLFDYWVFKEIWDD